MEMSFEIHCNPLGNPGSDFKATGTVIEIFLSFRVSLYFSIDFPTPAF